MSQTGRQSARETACGLLCRIFLHHNRGASVSLNKLGRFYHLLVKGLAESTLTEAIFHTCTEIFWSDLPGTTVLVWPFIQAAAEVFERQADDDDRLMLMQYAAARIISSIVCLPPVRTPGATLRVLPVNGEADTHPDNITQAAVEESLVNCCCDALSTCKDVQTEQVGGFVEDSHVLYMSCTVLCCAVYMWRSDASTWLFYTMSLCTLSQLMVCIVYVCTGSFAYSVYDQHSNTLVATGRHGVCNAIFHLVSVP